MAGAMFQVSSKLPDGRIFVVAADTYEEFRHHLNDVLGLEGTDKLINTMSASLEGVSLLDAAVSNVTSAIPGTTELPPRTSTPSTAPVGRSCKHGPMTKREGSSAKGPWKGYMCPTPKGTPDQCDAIFLRRNEPEWSTF
jgi:hypothetical protein